MAVRAELSTEPQITRDLNELADEIEKLSKAGEAIAKSRFKSKAILLLLSHASGVGQRDVADVLKALPELRATYLK